MKKYVLGVKFPSKPNYSRTLCHTEKQMTEQNNEVIDMIRTKELVVEASHTQKIYTIK